MVQSLKETKFYKRALQEDIEPTLRLETAPGLSWLARRNVQAAITDGSLVIDPSPPQHRIIAPCALCGEHKLDDKHARTHRMRISESDTAQRYPLCEYCVTRLRSVCDFLSFLKTLKEGLWKLETEEDENHAWEESVKLRERMFWARMGGGVVPAYTPRDRGQQNTPPRTPDEERLRIPKRRSKAMPLLPGEEEAGVRPEEVMCPPSPVDTPPPHEDDVEEDSKSVIRHGVVTAEPLPPLPSPLEEKEFVDKPLPEPPAKEAGRPASPELSVPGGW